MNIKVTGDEWERRKALNLPVTKELRYMRRNPSEGYTEIKVSEYCIVETYSPSGVHSLELTLETGEKIKILAPYFSEMQKPSFERDMEEQFRTGLTE